MPGCELLYIIQVKGFSWPYLISKILVAYNYSYNAASDWPRTFFTARLHITAFLDNQIDTQNENLKILIPGVHASLHRGCNENKN